jgi:hypothetical protein
MPTHCPFRMCNRLLALVRAVGIGSVLSAFLPASAMGTVHMQHDPSDRIFAAPSAQGGLPLPESVTRVPVHLRVRTREAPRSGSFDTRPIVHGGAADSDPAGASRPARPARPTVTILAPTDTAAVLTGTLSVRGTVSAHGDPVRVLVNGVRAVVRSGAFTAAVRVTPHTVILSAVATTPSGLTDRHQIGLAVSGAPEGGFPLRPFPDRGVVALAQRFSLLPASVSAFTQAEPDADGAGEPQAGGPGGRPFAFEGGIGRSPLLPVSGAEHPANRTTLRLVLAPAVLGGHGSAGRPAVPSQRLRVDVEGTRRDPAVHPRPEDRVEAVAPNGPGSATRDPSGIRPLLLGTRSEGDVEQNPRGMPLGATYSFGLLFIFDADGLRQVRWY